MNCSYFIKYFVSNYNFQLKNKIMIVGILFGLLSGVIAGMGMGGGTLLIPLLVIGLEYEQILAQGINLVAFIPMAVIVLIIQTKAKLVNYKKTFIMSIMGLVTAVGSSFLAKLIPPKILGVLFGVFLIIIAVYQLITLLSVKKNNSKLFSTRSLRLVRCGGEMGIMKNHAN